MIHKIKMTIKGMKINQIRNMAIKHSNCFVIYQAGRSIIVIESDNADKLSKYVNKNDKCFVQMEITSTFNTSFKINCYIDLEQLLSDNGFEILTK